MTSYNKLMDTLQEIYDRGGEKELKRYDLVLNHEDRDMFNPVRYITDYETDRKTIVTRVATDFGNFTCHPGRVSGILLRLG
jgi:succinate dehydrogenase flavin-adding protein (antitoxin of CptAB toxin-antitoxin module)